MAAAPTSGTIPDWHENYAVAHFVPLERTVVPRSVLCSCVQFAKWWTGREQESWGNASLIRPNTDTPRVGLLVLTTDGGGHIAVVLEVMEGSIRIAEANYTPCQYSERSIPYGSTIRGYFDPSL